MRKWEQMDDACFLILEFRHAHAELTKKTNNCCSQTYSKPDGSAGGKGKRLKPRTTDKATMIEQKNTKPCAFIHDISLLVYNTSRL